MEEKQIRLTITTIEFYTAEFLRELATAIEDNSELRTYETSIGCAEISWS